MFSGHLLKITGPPSILYLGLCKKIQLRQFASCQCSYGVQSLRRQSNITLPNVFDTICSQNIRNSSTAKLSQTNANKPQDNIKPKSKTSKSNEKTSFKTKPVNEEDIVEKYMASLSSDIHTKKRVYKNDLQKALTKVKEAKFLTKKQGLLLLRCCTQLLPDESPKSRIMLAEEIWNTIKSISTFDIDHYNELLRIYEANKRTVHAKTFIESMLPVKPDQTTYELLLRVLGECGDLNQATEVISNMKVNNLPATESVFNSLIICQGKSGAANVYKNIQEVLTMMDSLKIPRTADTYTSLARAYVWNKMKPKFLETMTEAQKAGIVFQETHIMSIVKTLPECGMNDIVQKVLSYLPEETLKTPSISPYMQVVATELVFRNEPMLALEIYKCLPIPSFGPVDDKGLHGRGLVRDCVKASTPSSLIALITQDLMASGRNPIAIQNAAEAALQLGKSPLALDLFTRMKQLGMPIRCHYFWPVLLQSMKSFGEKGLVETLRTMIIMECPPDYETMIDYVLPYVNFTSPQNLMKKFLEAELTATVVLTPMMETLINSGQVRAASEICELFYGKIDADKLVKPLVRGYLLTMDMKSVIHILEDTLKRATDPSKDWVGRFLCQLVKQKKMKENFHDLLLFLKELDAKDMSVSTSAVDYILNRIPENHEQRSEIKELLLKMTNENLIDDGDLFDQPMPHPKKMDVDGLRAHLTELEAKGMNTRGVLRKLLQEYCRRGMLREAREITAKCEKEGVFLSAGMKAAIFDLHIKLGQLDEAELILADLNKTAPYFMLDEYKVIDFATLMVYRKRIDKAFEMIHEQSKRRNVVGGRNISMNCWRLLNAVAASNSHVETRNMFDLLTSLGYCKPSNAICGPLVKSLLKEGDIEGAVNEFKRLANKYNKTPLKHELLCQIFYKMGYDGSEDMYIMNEKNNAWLNKFVQQILAIDKKIHGASDVQLTLISVLADVGYKKTLRKMFLDPAVKFHPDALMRRCERFADEKRVHALINLAQCAKDVRQIDVGEIYDLIVDVYQRDDDVKKAVELWYQMQDDNIVPSQKFVRTVCGMAKANNKSIPTELSILLDNQHTARNP